MRMLALCLLLCSCSTVYYAGLEKMGIPKRDLLERRVEKARDAQVETKEQFSSALERFRATVHVEGGELEQRYDSLRDELERCRSRADTLQARIHDVEDVADALFDEWQDELDDYQRADLRAASERELADTRRKYKPMIAAMKRAHQRVEPVLSALSDIVLALKHQLNAKAIGALQGELANVEKEVDALVKAMNSSIEQASKFLTNTENASQAGTTPTHRRS
jgi:chromosome segregation ATPase